MTTTSSTQLSLGGAPRVGPNAVDESTEDAQLTIPGAPEPPHRSPAGRGRRQPKHRIKSRRERAERQAGVPVRPISVSLPASVAGEWRAYSQRVKRSLVDVMLDAIVANSKDDRLYEIVRAHQSTVRSGRQPVSDGMFLRTRRPPGGDAAGETVEGEDPYVTVPLRMLSTNVDLLDEHAYKLAADSRSQFVVAVLTDYLAKKATAAHSAKEAPATN